MGGATGSPGVPAFLEQLVVRRELAVNFTWYNPLHDSYDGLPAWALRSLGEHDSDPRPYRYGFGDLLAARTHDPYWNAAQRELVHRGTMHGYMRMYWGKKILEWSSAPRMAFDTALLLNDTYQVDGRDPNGYAGVAWCFGKHDRPWVERPVFGNIRYMNDNGLRRKFDMDRYVKRIDALVTQEGSVE
jgi:deoxyribodipyrimidine photo-lyase